MYIYKKGEKMKKKIKRFFVGKPLRNEELDGEKLGVLWGLPILSSDAISSVAYAGQEILVVLIPTMGVIAYQKLTILSGLIILLLFILMLSYRQTIDSYPNGGGAYIVAKENIGLHAGVMAGAALSVDYVLTVAVSVSSGVEQITSAFTILKPYSVLICILLIGLLMIGNWRGISESSQIFGIPAYAFIFAIVSMLGFGLYKYFVLGYEPVNAILPNSGTSYSSWFIVIMMLKAFSSGCTALTGVEAISNSVPNFKKPSTVYAKRVLLLLSIIILILFGGTSILANIYQVQPGEKAMLILIAEQVFGRGFMFYFLTASTFVILIMAANTAYSGFPMLLSVISDDDLAPRQMGMRGDRLSYDNGITLLSLIAIVLIILFKAKVSSLIGLYAIGVFISFTLSQSGMLLKWLRERTGHWKVKAAINGFGAFITGIVVVIVAVTKFSEGAWIVVIVIPILMYLMLRVNKHYLAVSKQLHISEDEFVEIDVDDDIYRNRVIVPLESVNKSSIRALRFASTISDNVTAFSVIIHEDDEEKLRENYNKLESYIPLVIKYSPYRKVEEPLLKYITSAEYNCQKGDMITVLLPQFKLKRFWHRLLHTNTSSRIFKELMNHKHIVVAVMPLQLKDDYHALKKPNRSSIKPIKKD